MVLAHPYSEERILPMIKYPYLRLQLFANVGNPVVLIVVHNRLTGRHAYTYGNLLAVRSADRRYIDQLKLSWLVQPKYAQFAQSKLTRLKQSRRCNTDK